MASHLILRFLACLTLACVLAGCGYFQGNSSDADDEFADLELDDDTNRVLKIPGSKDADEEDEKEPLADDREPGAPLRGELGLRLKIGDRFPLQKTVEQRLTQPHENGVSTGHSRLDLMLSLNVEELHEGRIRFGARYHRVRYLEQDPEGRTVEYNSVAPAQEIPPQAAAYAGLVNNGFSFWIGPDNRLIDLVGFADFVQRCVRDIPPDLRQSVIDQLTADKGENGVASFIDDSIGLLPVSDDPRSSRVTVQEGTTWDLPERRIDSPVPLKITTRCRIKGLTERTADIDLFGSISAFNTAETKNNWIVGTRGGRCMGSCTVDRRTGLPINSRVERYLDLVFELPDGTKLQQRKEIVTTIQAFLDQDGGPSRSSDVRPAAFSDETPSFAEPKAAAKKSRSGTDDLRLFR